MVKRVISFRLPHQAVGLLRKDKPRHLVREEVVVQAGVLRHGRGRHCRDMRDHGMNKRHRQTSLRFGSLLWC